jgi:hypothetical protein
VLKLGSEASRTLPVIRMVITGIPDPTPGILRQK